MSSMDSGSSSGGRPPEELETQVRFLEAEVTDLRRRLTESPSQSRGMELRLADAQRSLAAVTAQNERLAETLREARDQIMKLKEEVDRLAQPPAGFGTFLTRNDDDSVDVFTGGRKLRVSVSPAVELDDAPAWPGGHAQRGPQRGRRLRLRRGRRGRDAQGDPGRRRARPGDRQRRRGARRPARRAAARRQPSAPATRCCSTSRSGYVYERVPKSEVEELVLEEVPDIDYDSIGGLVNQIDQIRDAVELPYLHPELFKEHQLKPPKGVLLYGPPGCGKTLIAKAVANSLAKKVAAKTGQEGKSYFLNIKGPELLNKYVGETERHIRLVFQRAREKASEGTPVIVFFDEMDSLFRTRGSGVSSDVENTIVPQLLSEIDGVELLENVLVIGASNREDMIDPAILRPGRLDVKIKIERPDAESARDIFSKYLLESLPLHADDLKEFGDDRDACVAGMIRATVERMYTETEENRFLEVTYANGDKEVLYFKDFNSGAMIQNIVDRAKKMAIKDFLEQQQRGLRISHLLQACVDEFKENEDLPNTTNPDDWARISGKKGERIVFIRTLITGKQGTEPGRSIDTVANTGQYL